MKDPGSYANPINSSFQTFRTTSISMMRLKQVRASISSFPLRMQNSYAAIPSSRSLATRYSCCRSPLTLLQWPHNSWRFSM